MTTELTEQGHYPRFRTNGKVMPRYRYQCKACDTKQIIVHRINDTLTGCPLCKESNCMSKLLTTPHIIGLSSEDPFVEVGQITKEYIESNREILQQQIQQAKKETYEPS